MSTATAATLAATRRKLLGTKHTRRIRQSGQLPAIVYGHGEEPVPIALDQKLVENALHHHERLLHVELDGKHEQFLVKAVQYDHLGTAPLHLDLMRVDLDERVTVSVELELRGTPKGAAEGGVLQQLISEVEVECIVTAIPEQIRHSVIDLGLNQMVHLGDLKLPEGVKIVGDPSAIVAVCRIPTEAPAATEEVVEGEAPAEPEVIKRAPSEEAEEEEGKKK
jgi:large subunit ribosomal protein L25